MNMHEEFYEALMGLGLSQDELQQLGELARMMGVLDAIVANETTDPDVLANWLYYDKDQILPLETMREIAVEYTQRLTDDGMLVDGVPVPEARAISEAHTMMLNADQTLM